MAGYDRTSQGVSPGGAQRLVRDMLVAIVAVAAAACSGSAAPARLVSQPQERIPQQYGARADCVHDDFAAFTAMFASGTLFRIPDAHPCYLIVIAPNSRPSIFALPAHAVLRGDGPRSRLIFSIKGGGYY